MPMQMGFRWYGEGNDRISLSDIRQIPGVSTIVWALHDKLPGEIWQPEEIKTVVDQIEAAGFNADVVESVNVHDDIKIGLPTRDRYIDNYIQTIRNLAPFGVKVICYNFMPIFDWTRSDMFHPVGDGSTALFYQKDMIQDDPKKMADYVMGLTEKYHMTFPGWEPERMAKLDELFENFRYFLERLMPVCHECDIKMAVHMDDPPWDIFGLPRLLVDAESIDRFLKMVDDPYNCLTLCSGSLNANPENNVAAIVRKHCDRIAFAHIRNVKHFPKQAFSTFCAPITTAALKVTSGPTTAVTSGTKNLAMCARGMGSMTAPSASCTCWAPGISWIRRLRNEAEQRGAEKPRRMGREGIPSSRL